MTVNNDVISITFYVFILGGCITSLHSQTQIVIDSAKGTLADGVNVLYAQDDGFQVTKAGNDGVFVNSADVAGIRIQHAGNDGVRIQNADVDGLSVGNAGRYGVIIGETESDAIRIQSPGEDGIYISNASDDGIHVVGATAWSLNVRGSKSQNPAAPEDHIAHIFNTHGTGGGDVLSLKINLINPGSTSNFVTFYDALDQMLGRIEGNGSGGVSFESNSADFAEFLPKESESSTFRAGDVVGIKDGKISLNTIDADRAMVITDRPIVIGNAQNNSDHFEKVSFIGQVPVKVMGMVKAGDWIVASGENDGTAVAVSTSEIGLGHQIIGQALASNADSGLKSINTIVGLDHSEARNPLLNKVQLELSEQRRLINALQRQIDQLLDRN